LIFLMLIIVRNFYPSGQFYDNLTFFVFDPSGKDKIIRLPAVFVGMVTFFFEYAFAVALWIVTYYRLKEKQV